MAVVCSSNLMAVAISQEVFAVVSWNEELNFQSSTHVL